MRNRRGQRGSVYRDRGFWYVRYYDDRVIEGELRRKRIAKKLVACDGVPAKKARELADQKLTDIIKTHLSPESALTLESFVDTIYFPRIEQRVRPSTMRGYRVVWND